jgi:hypothetical protein
MPATVVPDTDSDGSLKTLTLLMIQFSYFLYICLLWEAYRDCFHDFSFSLRVLEVSHVEGSSLTTSLRYQTSAFYEISKPKVD